MKQILDQLVRDCKAYRKTVDRILSGEVVSSSEWRLCLLDIQTRVVRLQLDRLIVIRKAENIKTLAKGSLRKLPRGDVKREMKHREQVKKRFEELAIWGQFKSENPLAELFGLRSAQDYIRSFELHLPEVYEETFAIEQTALLFIAHPNVAVLTQLVVALQHIGQNHINFLQPALDWASDEDRWD